MTNEEIDFTLRCYDQGLEAEDIYERMHEAVPFDHIVKLIASYEDAIVGESEWEAYY